MRIQQNLEIFFYSGQFYSVLCQLHNCLKGNTLSFTCIISASEMVNMIAKFFPTILRFQIWQELHYWRESKQCRTDHVEKPM